MAGSRKAQAREIIRDRQYHWEFLRRSDDYMRAYQEFREAHPGWLECRLDPQWPAKLGALRGEDSNNPPAGGFMVTAIERLEAFKARWGIDPTDPETRGTPFLKGRLWVIDDGHAEPASPDPDVLTLSINTAGPLKEVIGQLEWRIAFHQDQMQTRRRDRDAETKSRKRADKYDAYLKAHDLARQGQTDSQIAGYLDLADENAAASYRESAAELIDRAARGKW
jgi:hypothetical protein